MINIEKIKNDANLDQKSKDFAVALLTEVNEMHEKAIKGLVTETALGEKLAEVKKSIEGIDVKSVQDQVDNITKSLAELKNGLNPIEIKSIPKQIKESLTAEAIAKVNKGENVTIELKSPATMAVSSSLTGDVARVDRKPGVVWDPESMPALNNIIGAGSTNGNSVTIVEAYDEQGAPIFHLEGAAGGQMSWKWREKIFAVKDVSVWTKMTRNIMDDVDNFVSQVQNKLFQRLDKTVDAKLLAGNETSNPEEFNGLITLATAWDNGTKKTYKPTERDVIVVGIGQVLAYDHIPDVVVVNPTDLTTLRLAKAGKDNAILQFPELNGQIAGLRVVTSTRMTAGKFLILDSTKAMQHIRLAYELTISPSANDGDFQKRLMTINLTRRMAFEVSANNLKAFVYGDFATAKTAMTLTT